MGMTLLERRGIPLNRFKLRQFALYFLRSKTTKLSHNETSIEFRPTLIQVINICLGISCCLLAQESLAALASYSPVQEIDFSAIKKVETVNKITAEDVREVIPTTIRPTNDAGEVGTQIVDYSVNNFLNSPMVRNTSLGKTATKVEKTMQADVALGTPTVDENGKPGIQHKLNFAMQPAQALAQVKYSGFLNANLNYRVNNQELNVEMKRRLDHATEVIVQAATSPAMGSLSRLSLRWDWF